MLKLKEFKNLVAKMCYIIISSYLDLYLTR